MADTRENPRFMLQSLLDERCNPIWVRRDLTRLGTASKRQLGTRGSWPGPQSGLKKIPAPVTTPQRPLGTRGLFDLILFGTLLYHHDGNLIKALGTLGKLGGSPGVHTGGVSDPVSKINIDKKDPLSPLIKSFFEDTLRKGISDGISHHLELDQSNPFYKKAAPGTPVAARKLPVSKFPISRAKYIGILDNARFMPKIGYWRIVSELMTWKRINKLIGKAIPYVSIGTGFAAGVERRMEGDDAGAFWELISGGFACYAGWGTAVSLGISTGLILRDAAILYEQMEERRLATLNVQSHPRWRDILRKIDNQWLEKYLDIRFYMIRNRDSRSLDIEGLLDLPNKNINRPKTHLWATNPRSIDNKLLGAYRWIKPDSKIAKKSQPPTYANKPSALGKAPKSLRLNFPGVLKYWGIIGAYWLNQYPMRYMEPSTDQLYINNSHPTNIIGQPRTLWAANTSRNIYQHARKSRRLMFSEANNYSHPPAPSRSLPEKLNANNNLPADGWGNENYPLPHVSSALSTPNVQVTVNQTINAPGGDPNTIQNALADGGPQFAAAVEQALDKIMNRQQRQSMANVGA